VHGATEHNPSEKNIRFVVLGAYLFIIGAARQKQRGQFDRTLSLLEFRFQINNNRTIKIMHVVQIYPLFLEVVDI
jgi:hypothetical protein